MADPDRRRGIGLHLAAASLLVALLAVLYAPTFAHGLYSDDYALLLRSQKTSVGDILAHDLLGNFLRDNTWPYWRPGWYLLFNAVHALAGDASAPYLIAGFVMHTAVALAAWALLLRLACGPVPAALGALFFAVAPDYLEAVLWPAAAFNVLPCALLLLGSSALLLRWLERRRLSDYLGSLALAALSLTFKEAGYHLVPLCLLGALAVRRLDLLAALASVPFMALAALHYSFQNRVAAGGLGATEQAAATLHNAAAYVRALAGTGAGDGVVLGVAAGVLLAAFAVARGRERYFLVWTIVATFPYVVRAYGSRFAYFAHMPLAVFVTLVLARLAANRPRPVALAVWSLLALATALLAWRTAGSFAEYGRRGRVCGAAIASLQALGLDRFDTICVDTVPAELENGFADALELYTGKRFKVVALLAQRQPPFLVYWNREFETLDRSAAYLRWNPAAPRYELVTRDELVAGLVPVPVVAMRHAWRVFASDEELRRALVLDQADLRTTALLRREPEGLVAGPPPGREAGIVPRTTSLGVYEFDVDTDAPGLLVLCLPLDLTLVGARATLDGVPVSILQANGAFNAIPVPKGKHAVRVSAL